MGIGQHTSVADDDCLLDGMLQLADVAIPRMFSQLTTGRFGECKQTFIVLLGKAVHKSLGQWNDIFLTLAKRRYFQMDGIDAIEQVFAEATLCHTLVEVGIGGTNQAYIHGNGLVASYPHHTSVL